MCNMNADIAFNVVIIVHEDHAEILSCSSNTVIETNKVI